MKRFIGTIGKRSGIGWESISYPEDSPEGALVKAMTAFCESGSNNNVDDEYLHLPAIVDAAESSPEAAREAAVRIQRYLSKPASPDGYRQYNAVMLIRILADNPGETFTRNIDSRFVSTLRAILRDGRDMTVQQLLRETLEFLATRKASDTNLREVMEMWGKEKKKFEKLYGPGVAGPWAQPFTSNGNGNGNGNDQHSPDYFSRPHRSRGLPTAAELASRVEEANNSAKLLLQIVQTTQPSEFHENDLLKEFARRCQSASGSLQSYMESTDPPPEEETMLTLIETNERISFALSKYQRAALLARKMNPTQYSGQSSTQAVEEPVNSREPNPLPPISSPDIRTPSARSSSFKQKAMKFFQPSDRKQKSKQPVPADPARIETVECPPSISDGQVSPLEAEFSQPYGVARNGKTALTDLPSFDLNEPESENPFADRFNTQANNAGRLNGDRSGQRGKDPKASSSTIPQGSGLLIDDLYDDDHDYSPSDSSRQRTTFSSTAFTGTRFNN